MIYIRVRFKESARKKCILFVRCLINMRTLISVYRSRELLFVPRESGTTIAEVEHLFYALRQKGRLSTVLRRIFRTVFKCKDGFYKCIVKLSKLPVREQNVYTEKKR